MPNPYFVIPSFAVHAALAIWIGGAVFLGAVAAPGVFAGVPTRTLAGEIVGGMVGGFARMKLVCMIVIVLGAVVRFNRWEVWNGWTATRFGLIALACTLELIGTYAVGPLIMAAREDLREAGLDFEGDPADPRRRRFRRLHGLAMGLQGLAVLAAVGVLFTFS